MRQELKYIVPNYLLPELRALLLTQMIYDENVDEETKEYTVRSIYFDDKHLRYYHQKAFNHTDRKKVRLRGYGESPESKVVMEIKRKSSGSGTKDRHFVDYSQALESIQNKRVVSGSDDEVKFIYHIIRYQLHPTANIIYDREPFMERYETKNNLRITFDKNLRYKFMPRVDKLFSNESLVRAGGNNFILEVKFNYHFPEWLEQIVSSIGIRRSPASKYAISLDSSPLMRSHIARFAFNRPYLVSGSVA
ncbi:MAG: polyphosphate polymerase domain-containing protein [Candidatus Kapaibacteriales bacterium]